MDTTFIRSQFPGLDPDWVLMDNAGGSQIALPVIERMMEFYLTSNVQLGASYEVSSLATARVARSQEVMAGYINAGDPGEVILGSSTSLLLRMLAANLGRVWPAGSEIIVTDCDHEANIGCWMELERAGMVVKTWPINPDTYVLEIEKLEGLLSPQTRLVAFTHASNVIGSVNPVKAITELAHSKVAMVCVDGVAYAPHRLIDVREWDVDFYVFSFYKTYGPHYAMLYGRRDILLGLPGNNHFFIGQDELPYKFQPGNVNFEFAWGLTGLPAYLERLYDHHFPGNGNLQVRDKLAGAFNLIASHERALSEHLLAFLRSRAGVRIIGQPEATDTRVPTISFIVDGRDSADIVSEVDRHRFGIRYGDFYARRLIDKLELRSLNGVVRVSMVHYNTLEEVDRLVEVLDRIL